MLLYVSHRTFVARLSPPRKWGGEGLNAIPWRKQILTVSLRGIT